MRWALVLTSLLLTLPVGALIARQSLQERTPGGQFRTGTTGVVVDVVVRDKKGKPVTGLTAQDFELSEDGVRQDIFTVSEPVIVASDGQAGDAKKEPATASLGLGATAALAPGDGLSFTALVFDRLSPEARALARQTALRYLGERRGANEFAGIFVADLTLLTLQGYTNDIEALRRAIDGAEWRATSPFESEQAKSPSPTASAESASRPTVAGGAVRGADLLIAQMMARQDQHWDRLEREQQGHSTMNALMALCASLGVLPGRKTIVFFAESLAVPPAVEGRFHRLIDMANRENVAVYSVDAAGLRVHSEQAAVGRRTTAAGVASMDASASSPFGGGGTSDVFDMISRDPNVVLNILSRSTGGFLISNTNDLSRGLRGIDQDRRHYYLLTYSPKNAALDGKRRRIEVKLRNPGNTVRARSGYVASAP